LTCGTFFPGNLCFVFFIERDLIFEISVLEFPREFAKRSCDNNSTKSIFTQKTKKE